MSRLAHPARPALILLCLLASLPGRAEPTPSSAAAEPVASAVAAPPSAQRGEPIVPVEEHGVLADGRSMVRWASDRTADLISTSLGLLGVRYRRGASDPAQGFDCSGFVRHVYLQAVGLLLPHNAYSMSLQGRSVGLNELKPGDLVFFNTLRRQFSHVGIYLGDHRFIHAPSAGKTVQVDTLEDGYWSRHFNGARRMDPLELSPAATVGSVEESPRQP